MPLNLAGSKACLGEPERFPTLGEKVGGKESSIQYFQTPGKGNLVEIHLVAQKDGKTFLGFRHWTGYR
jgi:hypothetical protein